ncbi:MAG: AAA family ATPase, partial [Ignavibacteriae bacterium]|nr:AAA family ATPase [Ignavibacteriota bacterium]
MVLSFIDLKNFRLHSNTRLEFSKNINYIVGGNGQGKTSLLEAIYYLCTTKNLN